MNLALKIFMLVLLLFLLVFIIYTIKDKRLSMRYGSFWIITTLIMAILVIFPGGLIKISLLFGFEVASNMILFLGFFGLFCIIFVLTIGMSIQNKKIKELVQEISLLKVKMGKKD